MRVGFEVAEGHIPLFERDDWRYAFLMGGRGNGRSGTASRYVVSRLFGKEYTRGALMSPLTAAQVAMYGSFVPGSLNGSQSSYNGAGATSGNIPQQNNNPGAMRDPATGRFMTFATQAQGFTALQADLYNKMTGNTDTGLTPQSTLLDLANVWAPANDGNDPAQYAQKLAAQLGVPVSTPIGSLTGRVQDVANAIAVNEGFYAGQSSDANNAPTFSQYGALAKTDLNPSNTLDSSALNYLRSYFANGAPPSPTQLGISSRSGLGVSQFASVSKRASDLYTQATGQPLPDPKLIASNRKIIQGNNDLMNSLAVQDQTIQRNFGLSLTNLNENNINQALPILNSIANSFNTAMGDPATATYIAQNSTIQNELGSLLAVKNAQGTTVHDKLASAGLIPENAPASVQVAVVKQLLQEAQNAQGVLTSINGQLYKAVDPLMLDSANPNRQQTMNSQSVEQALEKQGLSYDSLLSEMQPQTPAGYVPALDAKTGQPAFATQVEINSGAYIPL